MNLLEVKSISKTYGSGETAVEALKNVSFSVPKGEFVAVVGESGSGKSTLLNMLGALDTPTSGKVFIDGKDTFSMKEKELTIFRRRNIGFLKVGDTIQIADTEIEVSCALSQGLFGDDLIVVCSQETFDRLMGIQKYGIIGIQLDINATDETLAQIRSLESDNIILTDRRKENQQDSATYYASRILCYGFLAIIGMITLLYIINNISMSVSARTKQYGAMRAVGMDSRQLTRMVFAESVTYAVSSLIAGCGIGIPLSRFLYTQLITRHFGILWRLPTVLLGIVIVYVFASAAIAVHAPSKRICNMEITKVINEL